MQDPKPYLDYLDKEMTIMGILSTFCVAIVALSTERIVSISPDSIAHCFVSTLIAKGSWYLIASSILVLVAAAWFYKERSQLAWFYGQIALESTIPNYTERRIEDWLKQVDSWEEWIPYTFAYWILIAAIVESLLAIFAMSCASFERFQFVFAIGIIVLLLPWLLWIRRNSIKFKYEETLPYFRL
jgi:hypothetical protein